MKRFIFLFSIFTLFWPGISAADDFLGIPIVRDAKIVKKTHGRLEFISPLSHQDLLAFYKEAVQGFQNIRFREWKDATYIEDDGKLPWHSITISKKGKGETTVVIMKDNWTWIIGTLILRFVGVFAVLVVLFGAMSFSGQIISRSVKKHEAAKGKAKV